MTSAQNIRGGVKVVGQAVSGPNRLLDIFELLESGQITEEQAVELLRVRRNRRYGRVGRIVEAFSW